MGLCKRRSTETTHYVVDRGGIRCFCNEHWTDVCVFMRGVRLCINCLRNHRADHYEEERGLVGIKFEGRWWDLCLNHFSAHDGAMCDFIPDMFED